METQIISLFDFQIGSLDKFITTHSPRKAKYDRRTYFEIPVSILQEIVYPEIMKWQQLPTNESEAVYNLTERLRDRVNNAQNNSDGLDQLLTLKSRIQNLDPFNADYENDYEAICIELQNEES